MGPDDLLGILAILALIGGLVLWIYSAIHSSKHYGASGRRSFVISLVIFLAVIGILYVVIVVPTLGCNGFLCGLGEILLFIGLTGLIFVIWPILFLAYVRAVLKKTAVDVKNEDIIDSEI